jgi:hypothetical protein
MAGIQRKTMLKRRFAKVKKTCLPAALVCVFACFEKIFAKVVKLSKETI